jgi:hypothetical protein
VALRVPEHEQEMIPDQPVEKLGVAIALKLRLQEVCGVDARHEIGVDRGRHVEAGISEIFRIDAHVTRQ